MSTIGSPIVGIKLHFDVGGFDEHGEETLFDFGGDKGGAPADEVKVGGAKV